jgi:hypothetical protein
MAVEDDEADEPDKDMLLNSYVAAPYRHRSSPQL